MMTVPQLLPAIHLGDISMDGSTNQGLALVASILIDHILAT